MVLTQSQYETASKEELIQKFRYQLKFCQWYQHNIEQLIGRINEFSPLYGNVYSELQQYKNFNSNLLSRITQLDCNTVTNLRYSRREAIELNPLPAESV